MVSRVRILRNWLFLFPLRCVIFYYSRHSIFSPMRNCKNQETEGELGGFVCKANYIFQCLLNSLTHKWRRISAPIKSRSESGKTKALLCAKTGKRDKENLAWRAAPPRLITGAPERDPIEGKRRREPVRQDEAEALIPEMYSCAGIPAARAGENISDVARRFKGMWHALRDAA